MEPGPQEPSLCRAWGRGGDAVTPALTAIGAAVRAGARQLQAQLVHTPAVTTALVTLHLPVVAVLVTARDEDS